MELTSHPISEVPQQRIDSIIDEDMGNRGPRDVSIPMADNATRDGLQIHMGRQKALELALYQTPRVEDNSNKKHQRIHAVNETHGPWADCVALPLYDAELSRKWTPPSSTRGSFTFDVLVPVRGIFAQHFHSHVHLSKLLDRLLH